MTTELQQNKDLVDVANNRSNLTSEQKNFLFVEYGQFKRPIEIIVNFNSTFNRTISDTTLARFSKVYRDDIRQVRDQWVKALSDEAGSHKRIRIQKIWKMITNLDDDFEALRQSLSDDQVKSHRIGIATYKQIDSLLNSLRVEMEGNTLHIHHRDLNKQKDDDLIDTARDVLNKVDPAMIEDANYDIIPDKDNEGGG